MKTMLEIFYLRIEGKNVRYQRRQVNLSRKGVDPDHLIESLIQQDASGSAGSEKEESREFLIHSTSWRYTPPGKVLLTYVAYSDELEFKKGTVGTLPLSRLGKITKKTHKPRSRTELERKVVAHAMRHIAFLIKTDRQNEFKKALTPETRNVFKKLWVSLAGRVF
jgi:hypothetical protein